MRADDVARAVKVLTRAVMDIQGRLDELEGIEWAGTTPPERLQAELEKYIGDLNDYEVEP